MNRARRFLGMLVMIAVAMWPLRAMAVTITGIMIYSTDDFGDPHGSQTDLSNPEPYLWITSAHNKWYLLAVYEGAAPESLSQRPLNNIANFNVNIPLNDGDNVFTVVAQPSKTTPGDLPEHFAINLYFDGLNEVPGISVLAPGKSTTLEGGATVRNRAQAIYAFGATLHQVRVPGVDDQEGYDSYDDGVVRVTVPMGSLASSATLAELDADVDVVSPHALEKSGINDEWPADFVGTITVSVGPSSGSPNIPGVGGGFVGGPGTTGGPAPRAGAGETGLGGAVPYVPSYANQQAAPYDDDAYAGNDDYDSTADVDDLIAEGHRTPTPKDAVDLLKNWLQDAGGTATPATSGTPETTGTPGTPGAEADTTATPKSVVTRTVAVAAALTPTPQLSPSVAASTTAVAATRTPTLTPSPVSPTPTAERSASPAKTAEP